MPWHGTKWSNCPGKDWMVQESNPGHLRHRPAVLPRHPRKDSPEGSTFRRKKWSNLLHIKFRSISFFWHRPKWKKSISWRKFSALIFASDASRPSLGLTWSRFFGKKIFLRNFFCEIFGSAPKRFFWRASSQVVSSVPLTRNQSYELSSACKTNFRRFYYNGNLISKRC